MRIQRRNLGYCKKDELRVFARALSEDDILQLTAGPTPVKPRGKLATTWAKLKHP
jgi:hypothetical protein